MRRKRQFYLWVLAVLPVLLVLNGLLFYSVKCNGEYLQSRNVWGMSQSVKVGDFVRREQIINSLSEDPEAAGTALDEIIEYLEFNERIKNSDYERYVAMLQGRPYEDTTIPPEENALIPEAMIVMGIEAEDIQNYKEVRALMETITGYEAYVKNVAENAGMIADSLYSIYDDEGMLKNLARCQKDYYGLEYLQLMPEQDNIFNLVIQYHVTDIFAVLYLVFAAIAYYGYIKGDSFGETHNYKRTTIGMLVLMMLGVFGLYGVNFVIADRMYGLPDMGSPLQSLGEYYVCPYQISVGGFVAVYLALKLVTLLLALGIGILTVTFKHRIAACMLAALFFGAEYWLHQGAPGKAVPGVLEEINLFSGVTAERFFNRYLNLNVAGMVLPRLPMFLAVLAVAFGAVAVAVYKRFGRWHTVSRQEVMNAYFGEIDKRYRETRLLWHDFNNHLLAIKALYENGRQEQAAKYIDDLSEQSYSKLLPAKTGSDTVDLLLFKKHQQAAEFGVTVRFHIGCGLEGLAVTEYDLCSLFGNILDNAIEAARKVEQAKRPVLLRVDRQNSMLFICCENPYQGELIQQDGELKTTKKDTAKHGIGLSSVKHICKKYNGSLELETEGQTFRISVLLNV